MQKQLEVLWVVLYNRGKEGLINSLATNKIVRGEMLK